MSLGQRRHIPGWLRRLRGWEEVPDWLLELTHRESGLAFVDLGTSPEEAGFAPAEGLAAGEETEMSAPLEWERAQPWSELPAAEGAEVASEAPSPEQEEGAGAAGPAKPSGVTDWLLELEGERPAKSAALPPAEMRERSGWTDQLQELTSEATGAGAEPGSEEGQAERPARPSGVTDWLARLEEGSSHAVRPGPEPFAPLPDLPAADEDRAAEGQDRDAPSWLADLQAPGAEEDTREGKEAPAAPDWLVGLESGSAIEEGLPAGRETGIPPWLAALEGDKAEEDVPEWLADLDSGGGIAAWLAEPEKGESAPGEATGPAAGGEAAEEEAGHPPLASPAGLDGAPLTEAGLQEDQLPDWLRSMGEATEDQQPHPEQEAGLAEPLPEGMVAEPAADEMPDWLRALDEAAGDRQPRLEEEIHLPDRLEEQEPAPSEEAAAEPAEEAIPDWLRALDEVVEDQEPEPEQEPALSEEAAGEPTEEETPDWLGVLDEIIGEPRPETEPQPDILRQAEQAESMAIEPVVAPGTIGEGDVEEAASEQEMPDWLRGLAIDEGEPEADLAPEPGAPMPDWLAPEAMPPTSAAVPESQEEEEPEGPVPPMPEWMEGVYAPREETLAGAETLSLPPAEEGADAGVPEWLAALEGEPAGPARQGSAVKASGPLAGLSGVLSPEPILASFPKSALQPIPPVPDAHQAEAELVERALETPASRRIQVSHATGRELLNSLGRWVIYGLLFAAVLIAPLRSCVRLPDLSETHTFYNAIEGLPPGSAVLVVFDYDASLDGALTPQARVILWHLQRQDLGIVLLSLTPQGAAIAEDLIAERKGMAAGRDYVDLGYLPPHPASLLAFMSNPLGGATRFGTTEGPAETVLGRQVGTFSDLDMIVTITGDRDHIRWWIEQVHSRAAIKLLAAVPAAITPYVEPYYSELGTGQLGGILGGLGPTAQYEELLQADFLPSARLNYVVQTNALLLFTGVVLVSGLGSLLGSLSRKSASRKARGSAGGVE